MKIFQVVPYYPPHIGGMEFYVQHLSEALAARGHDVVVFTSSTNGMQSIRKINGVRVYALKIMTKLYNIPIVPTLLPILIGSEMPDVVHTHQYPVFFSDMTAAYSWLKKTPLIVQVHVISEAKSPISGVISDMYYSTIGLRTLSAADTVVVPSISYKSLLSKMHINQKKLQVIPYGIDLHKFRKVDCLDFKRKYACCSSRVILTVGRLNYQKGFQFLIQALPAILKETPDTKLVIVGEGEQLAYLKSLVTSLELDGSVIFTGALSQTRIIAAYDACDVFVLPSLFESFGISLIEAQAMGKPVICTRTGGAPETLIEGKTGLIVEPANVKQLETAILYLLTNPVLSKEMGSEGQRFVHERYDIDKIVTNIVEQYENIAN